MRDGIKKRFDVQIYCPVERPTAFPCHSDRIKCRATGSIAVGVTVELRFQHGLQDHLHSRLRYAVSDRRNAERSQAAPALGYLDEPHRRRVIRTRRHPVPDLVQVSLKVLLERRQGNAHQRHPPRGSPVPVGRRSQISCFGILNGFASDNGSSHLWLTAVFGWRAGSLRSTRITRLRR